MTNLPEVYAALRRRDPGPNRLLAACSLVALLLITAYSGMMTSPTVLNVLPEGGDSRKQMNMVFVLALVGCGMFALYAAGLFLRQKSRNIGILMALGAPLAPLRGQLCRDILLHAALPAGLAGLALGLPLAAALWTTFRLTIANTPEMALRFSPRGLLVPLLFLLGLTALLWLMARRTARQVDVLQVIHAQHTAEPVHEVPRWYAGLGLALMALGAVLGYGMPGFIINTLHWYPPEALTAVFYLPLAAGLYMILLHTVVNGWRRSKNRYKDLIATSMMRFAGRQTVRSMLVMTLLLAGGCFAAFYVPAMAVSAAHSYTTRSAGFSWHNRADQSLPGEDEVRALAAQHGVELTRWAECEGAVLGVDGVREVETQAAMGVTYDLAYCEVLCGRTMLPASGYTALTGEAVQLPRGTVSAVMDVGLEGSYRFSADATRLTNVVSGTFLPVTQGPVLQNDLLFGCYVLNDEDYAALTAGLDPTWRERWVLFDAANEEAAYDFAHALLLELTTRSSDEVAVFDVYEPVGALVAQQAGEEYDYSMENLMKWGESPIDLTQPDSYNTRMNWKYMPRFRVLDEADFVKQMAVYLILFVFIALICLAAFCVVGYTRCLTLALTNAEVYRDLRLLGASNATLYRTVRGQLRRVFVAPVTVGTTTIYAFFALILLCNGDTLSLSLPELASLGVCLLLVLAVVAAIWALYRATLSKVCGQLGVTGARGRRRKATEKALAKGR